MSSAQTDTAESPPPKKHRHKKHHAAHHGGAWKVAYADFITTMMALFLLLWLLNASDQKTKKMVAQYFRDPGIFESSQGGSFLLGTGTSDRSEAVPVPEMVGRPTPGKGGTIASYSINQVADMIRTSMSTSGALKGLRDHLIITPKPDGIVIDVVELRGKPLFSSGKVKPLLEGEAILEQLGTVLSLIPEFDLMMAGHTDSAPFGKGGGAKGRGIYSNWDLSLDRAQESAKILLKNGIPESRILSLAGYADTQPFKPEDPFDEKNRRISITLKKTVAKNKPLNTAPIENILKKKEEIQEDINKPRYVDPSRLTQPEEKNNKVNVDIEKGTTTH